LDEEHFTFEIPGVNHFVWLTRCYYQGEDVFPMLDSYLRDEAAHGRPYGDLRPKDVDLYRRFGVFPIGDTTSCGGGAWPWWYHTDDATEQQWGENPPETWSHYFDKTSKASAESGEIARNPGVKVTDRIAPTRSREVIIPMIESMACDIPRVMIGNIMNTGDFVQGVPRDFEVEIPLFVSKRGAQGIQTTRLPDSVLAYITAERVGPVNLELQAYEQGSKQLLLQLLMMDPFARSEAQCDQLLNAIFALPYHQKMREHFT
jgi:alpha-galactosidase